MAIQNREPKLRYIQGIADKLSLIIHNRGLIYAQIELADTEFILRSQEVCPAFE